MDPSSGMTAGVQDDSLATTSRAIPSACRSSSARYSPSPDTAVCISAPPSSSSVATSPVAAINKGGPARNARDRLRTITTTSLSPGM